MHVNPHGSTCIQHTTLSYVLRALKVTWEVGQALSCKLSLCVFKILILF